MINFGGKSNICELGISGAPLILRLNKLECLQMINFGGKSNICELGISGAPLILRLNKLECLPMTKYFCKV
jgi:hypothetical protein